MYRIKVLLLIVSLQVAVFLYIHHVVPFFVPLVLALATFSRLLNKHFTRFQ